MAYKLGKKLGVVHDPRTFKLTPLLTSATPEPPRRHSVALNATFPMFGNDSYGDCTFAGQGHRIIAQERSTAQSATPTITTADVLKGYSAVTGFDPNRPETDQGAYLIDVLNYMRKTGIGREKDGTAHMIYAFAKVDTKNLHEVMTAHYLFGGLYIGAALPVAAQDQVGGLWDLTGNSRQDEFGSWGGHAMYVQSFNRDHGPTAVTWADRQAMTWNWWTTYVDECYAIISEDFLRTRVGTTPQGFDRAKLDTWLSQL